MKKYWYIIIVLVIVLIGAIVLFAKDTKTVKIDIDKVAKEILRNVKFEDEMNEIDSQTVKRLYDIDNAISQKVYISSGATAEEIAIFEFQSKNEINAALDKINKRIEEQKESFEDYIPKEIRKLEDTIIIKKDRYLIICITGDENAEKIIEKYTK